jgi:hypothetical protein
LVEGFFVDGVLNGSGRREHDGLQEIGTFATGLLHGAGLQLMGDRYLHEGKFHRGELHKYGHIETPKLRYRGWVEHNSPCDHGVCEFGESRRVLNPFTKATVAIPQFPCEGRWLGGAPIRLQSGVQERRFARTDGADEAAARAKADSAEERLRKAKAAKEAARAGAGKPAAPVDAAAEAKRAPPTSSLSDATTSARSTGARRSGIIRRSS